MNQANCAMRSPLARAGVGVSSHPTLGDLILVGSNTPWKIERKQGMQSAARKDVLTPDSFDWRLNSLSFLICFWQLQSR